ncbi:hypothetical protein N8469_00105 [bacterium]|nr:hypothetical protein [bacterium]
MALIDKTTDITSFDYKKVRKTNTTENGTFKTNQRNNTDKKTNFNNTKIEQQYSKLSPDDGQLIKKDIGDKYRSTKLDEGLYRGGAALNVERNVEDVERIGKFLTTPKGLLFTGKQILLQKSNASEHTRGYKIESPITNRPPFLRDERHRPSQTYEEVKGISQEGTITPQVGDEEAKDLRNAVQPVVLKSRGDKPRGTLTIGKVNTGLQKEQKNIELNTKDVKDGNRLNPIITSNEDDLPKDFINFRIKDMVNNQFIQFPAYLTDITDNSSAEYNPTRYIGRPDQVFVYSGYTRNISFGFRVAALKKEDIPILWRKVDKLKLLTLPTFAKRIIEDDNGEKLLENEERPIAPFVELTLGNLLREQPGYFSSVNVTIPQSSTWELQDGFQLPHICDVTVEFTFVGRVTPQNFKMTHEHTGIGGVHGNLTDNTHTLDNPSTFNIGPKK